MSTEVVKTQEEIRHSKIASWRNFGGIVYDTEISLQLEAQKIQARIILPKDINEVLLAENTLKEVKSARAQMEETRKNNVTNILNGLGKRLISYEQSLDVPILEAEKAIIKVKKEHEEKQRKQQQIDMEKNLIREKALSKKAEVEAGFKAKIQEITANALTNALDTDVAPELLANYLNPLKLRYNANDFKSQFPSFQVQHITQQEMLNIVTEVFKVDSESFLQELHSAINEKFADYAVAYANKEEAKRISQQETADALKKIEEEKGNQQLGAKLEAMATPLTGSVSAPVKELKKSFEVDLPNTKENIPLITAAFVANWAKVLPLMGRINNADAFTIGQMKNYLGKLKTEDNNWAFTGITFKEVSKL